MTKAKTASAFEAGDIGPLKGTDTYFGLVSHKYNMYSAVVSAKVTEKDLQNPKYWEHIARNLRPGDEIRCLADDSSFVARCIVLFVSGTDAKVRVESFTTFTSLDTQSYAADKDYAIRNGGFTGWYVQKVSTGERVISGLASEADGFKALAEYKKSIAA